MVLVTFAAPSSGAGPEGTGMASDNVQHVATIPFDAGAATSARLLGDYLYVAGSKQFSIYDVSDPLNPALQSITPVGFFFANEDVDTNGKILLLSDEQGATHSLHVYDVEDKTAPVKVATVANAPDHTFTCVFHCTYAYGARGSIIDLRNPTKAKMVGNWFPGMQPGYGFDVTEVSPGIVLTSSRQMHLLDARKDVLNPEFVASGYTTDDRLIHSNRWPNHGRDRFYLVQAETFAETRCDEDSGAFMTWDTRGWRKTRTFEVADEYRAVNGNFIDGSPPANAAGCTAMWFQEHPDFDDGGLVATAWFEHGARFLRVGHDGKISEVGYFMPVGGSTIATYWITDEIVYAIDLVRGIDILRFTGTP
ncbi:MAG: hypothetical protein QOG54_450 [Actinomycetota bacterium]|jgi:hypothetical protein|nr:hypothetical protein [Actinomycetota bacterium]